MALGLLELVILVIRCIVEEFKDLYDQRKSYSSWFWYVDLRPLVTRA